MNDSVSNALNEAKVSSVSLTQGYLENIKKHDDDIGSFLQIFYDDCLRDAEASDNRRREGRPLSLIDGMPIAIKDNIITKGFETTCASKILKGYIPPYNATVIEKLKSAGAVILGKLNMDEFAMGSSSEHSAFKPVKNPWDISRTPGGSSGGSAASVAAEFCAASLGSDTGGSIRQPAALCGVVGLKPTYGRVSRFGLVAFASSLDQIGPFAKTVTDCALVANIISGHDNNDSTSSPLPVEDYLSEIKKGVKDLKIGLPKEYFIDGIDDETKTAIDKAVETYKGLGAKFIEISLPHTEYAVPTYYIISSAEASSNLARYDGIRYGMREKANDIENLYENTRSMGFGNEVILRIMLGTFVLSTGYYDAYYRKAQKVKALIASDFANAFERCDLILTPTSPTPAFKMGERINDPIKMYLSDIFTIAANLASIPAISVPCGFTKDSLPIGMQLITKPFGERLLFRAAHAYEKEEPWWKMAPTLEAK